MFTDGKRVRYSTQRRDDPDTAFMRRALAAMTLELEQIRTGAVVVMPISLQHAEAMHLIAEAYIKQHRK